MKKEENRRVTFILSGTQEDLCQLLGEVIIESISSKLCKREI